MAKSLDKINFTELKAAIKALNEECGVDPAMRTVGVAKAVMIENFEATIAKLSEEEVEIPALAIQFYNDNLADDAVDPEPTTKEKEREERKNKREKKEKEKKEPKEKKPKGSTGWPVLDLEGVKAKLKDPKNPTHHAMSLFIGGCTLPNAIKLNEEWCKKNGGTPWKAGMFKQNFSYVKTKWGWKVEVTGEGDKAIYQYKIG